jgi:thymidine phosphorylase
MHPVKEIILRKRDGAELGPDEIGAFVTGVREDRVCDAQIAAFCMAVWFRGMSLAEQRDLTFAMRDSGRVLQWPGLDGPVLDKHSTGGVGDLVSLVLGPVVAACGGFVPMISGRGLGHTGGTLDKLESIPGVDCALPVERFQRLVRDCGVAIVGQTAELAPADRRIYAVRDVTSTVAATPLIVSSILSKKLAEGLDGLVMDVKFGRGAFMPDVDAAQRLARDISGVAAAAGLRCNALVTDMDWPLAPCAGNALEVREAVRLLQGGGRDERLRELVQELSAEMLVLGGLAAGLDEGRSAAAQAIESGRAAERFARMVQGQGGPGDLLENSDAILPAARVVRPVTVEEAAQVAAIDVRALGTLVMDLGGGRHRSEDEVDPSVGLSELAQPGQWVDSGGPIGVIHAAGEADWERAAAALRRAYRLGETSARPDPVVACRIVGENSDEANR